MVGEEVVRKAVLKAAVRHTMRAASPTMYDGDLSMIDDDYV